MAAIRPLPLVSSFSFSVFTFFDGKFGDLSHSPSLVSELRAEISELDRRWFELNFRVKSGLSAYVSFPNRAYGLFVRVNVMLVDLSSSTCVPGSESDHGACARAGASGICEGGRTSGDRASLCWGEFVSTGFIYLVKEILPIYVGKLKDKNEISLRPEARVSWLHLVDLMISFDKLVQSLVSQSGMLSLQEDGNLHRISSRPVFCDSPDWIDLWAEIKLDDVLNKLNPYCSSASIIHNRKMLITTIRTFEGKVSETSCSPIIQKFLDCIIL